MGRSKNRLSMPTVDMYNKEIADEGEEPDDLSTKELTYRKFLIYRDFYVAQTPVILKGIPRSYFGQRFEEYHKLTSEILYLKCDAKISFSGRWACRTGPRKYPEPRARRPRRNRDSRHRQAVPHLAALPPAEA